MCAWIVCRSVDHQALTQLHPLERQLAWDIEADAACLAGAGMSVHACQALHGRAAEQQLLCKQLQAHTLEVLDAMPTNHITPIEDGTS